MGCGVERVEAQRRGFSGALRAKETLYPNPWHWGPTLPLSRGISLRVGKEENHALYPRPSLPDKLSLRFSQAFALKLCEHKVFRDQLHPRLRLPGKGGASEAGS